MELIEASARYWRDSFATIQKSDVPPPAYVLLPGRGLVRARLDRPRELWHPPGTLLAIDEDGGAALWALDPAELVALMLQWQCDMRATAERNALLAAAGVLEFPR